VDIYIYIFYTSDLQDDLPLSKRVATLEIKHTSCLLAAVKRATEWPDKRLPAIARQWVLWNLSDETVAVPQTVIGVKSITPAAGKLTVAGPLE
jgi:hypothetical protein